MMKDAEDKRWMKEALSEAKKGIGLTAPNPAVGAVIVKDGRELARGWHRKSGTPHAERDALSKVDDPCELSGATIYVTLEPCSTQGRTGACSEAILESGIQRVVYGARDPNPAHAGAADHLFRQAGIEVLSGFCQTECEDLIRAFAKVQTTGLPWVIAKTAMSLDGRITRPSGEGQWLTGPVAREEVQLLRAEVDAILTSGETVRRDNPALTLRSKAISPEKSQPLRVILTRTGLAEADFQIFHDDLPTRVFDDLPSEDVLRTLAAEEGVNTVLLECGGRLMGNFLDAGLIDEIVVYLAPMVTGGLLPALGGEGVKNLTERWSLIDPLIKQVGPDLMARGRVSRKASSLER